VFRVSDRGPGRWFHDASGPVRGRLGCASPACSGTRRQLARPASSQQLGVRRLAAAFSLAFSSGVVSCLGSRRLGSAQWASSRRTLGAAAVACRGVQRQPLAFGVGLVDRGSGRNEPVDDLQALVAGGEHQRPEPALQREPVQRPACDATRGGGHLQAVNLGPGGHQDIHDVGHAEHSRMLERGAVGHAAGAGGGDGLDVGLDVDEYSGDLGVARAGRGDQRSSGPDPANGLATFGEDRPEPTGATGRAGARPAP
jgi:hypothetical protein